MRVTISERDAVAVAAVDSSILQENVPMLRARLSQLLEENRRWIVIDLSKANYLSSMGVAVIVDVKLKANKANGDVKLACVNQLIRSLLDITNVTRKMDIFSTVDEAIEAVKKEAREREE
ncbi:MAG: STAS domain-containing protein [Chitinivibrionales bacterium]|nr:STAS domain-containing protein [Chitinivibrionales bacterium]MBD3395439.1 STAS domain-containing protein [Chitinivibrionales bacterium]